MNRCKTTTIFTLGFVTWAAGAMAVAVSGFGIYDPAWGREMSYHVVLWFISGASIVAATRVFLGTKPIAAPLSRWKTFSYSSTFTLVFCALNYLAGYLDRFGVEQDQRLLILGLLTFASSFAAAQLLAQHTSSLNQPLNAADQSVGR